MTGDQVLWAVGFFFLGVVFGVRLGVWWFTVGKPQSDQINADVATLRNMPRGDVDEPELPYRSQSPLFDEDGLLR